MNQPVVIKSNKYGLIVILDGQLEWRELLQEVARKFQSSAKFFGEAQMALLFQGRRLTLEEELELTETIESSCQIQVVCVADEDEVREEQLRRAMERRQGGSSPQRQSASAPQRQAAQAEQPELSNLQDGRFYKGTLRSGQVLEAETSVIILGDVNPGASVISGGNVIVLGTLKGNIYAGASGNASSFVAALSMDPMQIRIGDVIARCSDAAPQKKKRKDKEEQNPKIAFVEDGNIYIEPMTKEVLNDINI